MNKLSTYGAAVIVSLSLFGCGDNRTATDSAENSQSTINSADKAINDRTANRATILRGTFWERAVQGAMMKVATANLALSKSQNDEVRNFAQTIITDHTQVSNELKELAAQKKIALPTRMGEYQLTLEQLNRFTSTDFDKNYVEAMVGAYEDDVELFKNEAQNSMDAELKTFAAKTLPTLQAHLKMIRDVQSRIN